MPPCLRERRVAALPPTGAQDRFGAAGKLSKEKHELEQEIEKAKIDIAYCERVVTDEKVIAGALLNFKKVVKTLSFDEQRELLTLILRKVTVNRIDPDKDPMPTNPHTWSTQKRTQWYAVNLELFANWRKGGLIRLCLALRVSRHEICLAPLGSN